MPKCTYGGTDSPAIHTYSYWLLLLEFPDSTQALEDIRLGKQIGLKKSSSTVWGKHVLPLIEFSKAV